MSGTRRARPSPGGPTLLASSPWVVVATGAVVMVVLLIVALLSSRAGPDVDAGAGEPAATVPLPGLPPPSPSRAAATLPAPVVPGLSPRRSDPPATAAPTLTAAVPTPSGAGVAPPQPPRPPAPPPAVAGRYRVLDTFDDAFIGEVLLTNSRPDARGWTVRLELPRGELVTSWVEGAPQGSARMDGRVFTYTSGVDLAGGASVPLRFHFERTGGNTRPSSCAVDGATCAGL